MTVDNTKQKILDAACQLFSEKGYAAVSISQLAKAAKINQSLIYHYFENKADLWRAVKMDILDNFNQAGVKRLAEIHLIDNFENYIESFIALRFAIFSDNQALRRIIRWQSLEDNEENALWGTCSNDFTLIYEKLSAFQARGDINASIDIHHLLIMMFTLPLNYFNYEKRFTSMKNESSQKKYVELVINAIVLAAK